MRRAACMHHEAQEQRTAERVGKVDQRLVQGAERVFAPIGASKLERSRLLAASGFGRLESAGEIAEVENGRFEINASPLRHAPHTVHDIADDDWKRAYGRAEGCFPAGTSRMDKYWSPVGRVDNVYGDRNLVCSCPPVEDYAQAAE